jgi:serine/threonine protein phosphatase 1
MDKLTKNLIINPLGKRVFFCGDVHGEKGVLSTALLSIGFIEKKDTLIFTGDVIDRGPNSAEIIDFIANTPNVYSVIGNHEQTFLAALTDDWVKSVYIDHRMGGGWIEHCSKKQLISLRDKIRSFPLSITVNFQEKRLGVIHACAPNDWDSLTTASEEEWEIYLWERDQYHNSKKGLIHTVKNIDWVIHGHVGGNKVTSGNHIWIDTFHSTGRLTIIEISEIISSNMNV